MEQVWSHNWVLLSVLALGILVVAFTIGPEAAVAKRVFAQFFITIAFPLFVIMGGLLVLIGLYTDLPVPVMQAIVAGFVVASGWVTTAIFSELTRLRGRAEKLRDYHKAIIAEIGNTLEAFRAEMRAGDYQFTIDRMQNDPSYVPMIPQEHRDHIYNSIVEQIDVLPRDTIDAIVAYYTLMKSIRALAGDTRSEMFTALPQERRVAMYSDYVKMREQAYEFGRYTVKLIKAYSESGRAGADAFKRSFNTRDADQSGLLQGSE